MPRWRKRGSGAADYLPRFLEHGVEHRAGEEAGLRIALARMVGADQRDAPRQAIDFLVAELRNRLREFVAHFTAGLQIMVEGDFPQRNHHL